MDDKYRAFNYTGGFLLFFFLDQDDRQENGAVESIITDSDDCIVSSPLSKNIKQVSQSIYGIIW